MLIFFNNELSMDQTIVWVLSIEMAYMQRCQSQKKIDVPRRYHDLIQPEKVTAVCL